MSAKNVLRMSKTTLCLTLGPLVPTNSRKNFSYSEKTWNYLPAAIIRVHHGATSGTDLVVSYLKGNPPVYNLKIWTLLLKCRVFPNIMHNLNIQNAFTYKEIALFNVLKISKNTAGEHFFSLTTASIIA